MACQLTFICVPMGKRAGKNGDVALLDVLMTPTCDQKSQIQKLLDWGEAVRSSANDFTLESGGSGPLTFHTDKIQPGLWKDLFEDADVGSADTPAPPTPIAPHGLSLSTTHELAHQFYASAYKAKIDDSKHAPDQSFLLGLHNEAIQNHGLYEKNEDSLEFQAEPEFTEAARRVAALLAGPAPDPQAQNAATLIRKRFGVLPPPAPPGNGRMFAMLVESRPPGAIRTPAKATKALNVLHFHIANSLRVAAGIPPENNPPPSPKHLVPHVNRLVSSPSDQQALGAKNLAAGAVAAKPYTFAQRVTILLTMPALLDALGLVLHFELPWDKISAPGEVKLRIPAALQAFGVPIPRITLSNAQFLPRPRSAAAILDNGWIQKDDGYKVGSLQLDSAAMQITQFANQAGLRQASMSTRFAPPSPVMVSYDEDISHPVLPPSPHTGGLQVWQEERQSKVYDKRQTAMKNAQDASQPLFAEDLKTGVVADVLAIDPDHPEKEGSWIHLCRRDEEFKIKDIRISEKKVERGAKTSAARPIDPGISAPLSHDVDETIFTWRLGSVVAKSPLARKGKGMPSGTPTAYPPQIPWGNFGKAHFSEAEPVPSPLFGWTYRVALRAVFAPGGVVPFDNAIARQTALPEQPFQRYELIQGPALIPIVITENYLPQQTPTLMFVGSRVQNDLSVKTYTKLSQRVIVPAKVSEEVARRHGKSEHDIEQGAVIFPLKDGVLPSEITISPLAAQSSGTYLPDPLCVGVIAILTDLDGKVIDTKALDFYNPGDARWPDYAPHVVELQASSSPDPSLAVDDITSAPRALPFLNPSLSKAFVCKIPPGKTYLLALRPKLDPENITNVHAFSLMTAAGPSAANLDVNRLALSDICRPTMVRLTHATDRPVAKPVVTMKPALSSNIVSVPDPNSVNLGATVDPQSTSKVSLLATWQEYTDDLKQPSYTVKTLPAKLAEFHVSKRPSATETPVPGNIPPVKVQFPFSDGRYRGVKVVARGTSRYGGVFGKTDDPSVTLDSDPVTLEMLSTAQPKMPDIEYVLPNLRWELADAKRTRRMGLTIVLNRPWFTSGADEQLTVITAASNTVVNSIATSFTQVNTENNVSAWGVLADWSNLLPPGAQGQRITLQADVKRAKDKDAAAPPPDLPTSGLVTVPGDTTTTYSALFFTPRFNELDQQWYVNLEFSKAPVYGAVVRLLVARYQPHAPDNLRLSPVSMCDFSLLRPERSVLISTTGSVFNRKKRIQIVGVGPYVPEGPANSKIPRTVIEVRFFETRGDKPHEFEWQQGELVEMDAGLPSTGNILWQATVPAPVIGGGGRLVAQEREVWPTAEDKNLTDSLPVYFDVIDL